jgi:hypothetical protein
MLGAGFFLVHALTMKTVVIGEEFDESCRRALGDVLHSLGAVEVRREGGHAGSQQIEVLEVAIGEERVWVESETYRGISIRGSEGIVDQIATRVKALSQR